MTTGIPSGIAAQFGFKAESTYGTGVTVDSFLPMVKENLKLNIDRLEAKAIRAGRTVLDALDWMPGKKWVDGTTDFELENLTIQKILLHAFGTVVDSGAGPFVHTYTPTDVLAKSLTVQIGRPSTDGTVNPFTYTGMKIDKFAIDCKQGEIATVSVDWLGQAETTATALASASYTANINAFTFVEGSLTIAGSNVAVVQECTFEIDNNFAQRFFLGASTLSQPLLNDLRTITGVATLEFDTNGITHYARYTGATTSALVLTFTDGTSTLAITLNARYDGTTPNVDSRDVLNFPYPFKAIGTTDAAACTAVFTNADTLGT